MRTRQAIIEQTGGPEVIQWREIELPDPGPGQVLVRHSAVGLNFIDTYHRSGLYPIDLPGTLGLEAAGTVEATGDGVTHVKVGDRVATFGPNRAAYADYQLTTEDSLFKVPEGISLEVAAAVLLKGLTTEMLAERVAPVTPGGWALVHAAAGGVGQLLVQWLVARGVRVIATAGSAEKCARALALGAEHAIDAGAGDLAAQVREITGGAGVRASYDGVGKATWEASLAATGRRGVIASFGNASGPVTGVNLGSLAAAGSLFVSRPTLFDYYREPTERAEGSAKLWSLIESGRLTVEIGQTYPLAEAAQAHRDIEGRRTTGSTLLVP
ncbi:Quinone oxidoreductase 1 [Tsuneonella dongtanensis]|uniref:Quinone oxidoreductase 1 n=1 Tax=Tsuneonella dongtanensis TaxID=692370 RepID=A0A1B2ADZ8_9SPHN|nr:quinone oxidoreductase [Tsuneonella dongtanensis]ANY20364.1 Quinone oxidoreductase 1 [Tsuneonella dongtanensis]